MCALTAKITTFDFKDGNGPVPAHRHVNGGGWVADTASVSDTAYVGFDAHVYGYATVDDFAVISEAADVSGFSIVCDAAYVHGKSVIKGSCIIADNAEITGNTFFAGHFQIGGDQKFSDTQCVFNIADCLNCPALRGDNYTASHHNPCLDCLGKYRQKKLQSDVMSDWRNAADG